MTNIKYRISIILILFLLIGGVVYLRNSGQDSAPGTVGADKIAELLTETTGSESGATDPQPLPYLVDLGSQGCMPCKMMAPTLEELAVEYPDDFHTVFIDVRERPEANQAFQIMVIPTQVFLDAQHNELFRHEGYFSKKEIIDTWMSLGYDFSR